MASQEESSPHFCLRCRHIHSPHDGKCIVNLKTDGRACICDQDSYVPQKPDQAHKSERYYFQLFQTLNDLTKRTEQTIVTIPGARDQPDWDFEQTCWRYWFGFKIGDVFTAEIAQRIREEGQPESIRRTRQKICHEELETLRNFQERLNHTKEFSDEYWAITKELQKFWTESKYIPKNIEFLKAKGIKQSVIFEWSIEELNNIC